MKEFLLIPSDLEHHLRVVADHYEDSARVMQRKARQRVADQFMRQAKECRDIADALSYFEDAIPLEYEAD